MNINTGKALNKLESLSQSINLILLTPKNERVLNRFFGSNVSSYLGQPMNAVAMQIRGEVVSSLQSNDSRILVDNVSLQSNDDSGINIDITYNSGEITNVRI